MEATARLGSHRQSGLAVLDTTRPQQCCAAGRDGRPAPAPAPAPAAAAAGHHPPRHRRLALAAGRAQDQDVSRTVLLLSTTQQVNM